MEEKRSRLAGAARALGALAAVVVAAGSLAACGSSSSSSSTSSGSPASTVAATDTSSAAAPVQAAKEPNAVAFQQAAPGSAKGLKIGFISLGEQVPFGHLVTTGMRQQVERAGGTFVFCDSKGDGATALDCAKTLRTQGVDGYLNFQSDSRSAPAICAAGPQVPVIAVDIQQPPCQKAFMGANNEYAGELAGQAVATYFKQRFDCKYDAYVSLNGFESGEVNTQRMGGYDRGFASVCGKIQNERRVQADRIDQAQSTFTDVLTSLPGKHHIIVVGLNDDGIEGALAAAKTQGRQGDLYVSGQGADPSSWCQIKSNPQWIGDTAYFPERYAQIGVPYLIKLIRGQTVPKLLLVPHAIINGQNIDRYYHPTNC
jgi:ribose transport system substrate-binding protein